VASLGSIPTQRKRGAIDRRNRRSLALALDPAKNGVGIPESKNLRHLLLGKKPNTYRIIYAVDKRNHIVNVLHFRHGARAALSAE
jgi:mRNA-degrading endonuclease RelE of RelBE toxin-antitoxin system